MIRLLYYLPKGMREYKRVLECDIDIGVLNTLGIKGWELVGISTGDIPVHNVLYFKRKLF